jgi:hypothetical protein
MYCTCYKELTIKGKGIYLGISPFFLYLSLAELNLTCLLLLSVLDAERDQALIVLSPA